jgi:dipeptidyl aminopeptidase/acylaminoacyl peptidase
MPGAPTLTPDGRIAVVAVTRPDLNADDYTSQLWLVPTGGGDPRRLTEGWRDASPRISPDGQWIAFTRVTRAAGSRAGGHASTHDDKPQLCVLPLQGGEARRLTDQPLGVGAAAWSPDSSRLAYAARVPEQGRYGTGTDVLGEKIGPGAEPPRRITKLNYRRDGIGFLHDQPSQLFVTGLDGDTTRLTDDGFSYGDPAFSPDGEWLTFAAARHEAADDDSACDIWIMAATGGDPRLLTDTTLDARGPLFSPDGASVLFLACWAGEDRRNPVARGEVPYLVPAAGGEVRRLLDPEDYQVAVPSGELVPTPGGLLFPTERRGAVHLVRVPYDGGPVEPVLGGERMVTGAAAAGDVLVTTIASTGDWGEVYAGERRLTDFSADYRESATVLVQEELDGAAPDGYPVHGWIVRPEGAGPHPVLLMIHGGPFAQYGWRLFDEAQVYAAAGYAVVYGNPRGSSGYGESHGRAIVGNVGRASAIDLLALLDTALKAPDLDGDRVGVLGGSHGGYMTTWLSAHHGDRFKAAVSERAVNATDSFVGSSDIGSFFADALWGPQDSPLDYADRIELPMLIIHSEQDWRCPLEQAQRLYVALRRRGVPTEMLLFPGEGHEMSRAGLPSHRIARFEAIVEWFQRHV